MKLTGVLAWWFWFAAHVFFLIGFRNRMVELLDWAWAYWSYQRGARIIRGGDEDRSKRQVVVIGPERQAACALG